LEREQERREEAERKEGQWGTSFKVEQSKGIWAIIAMASSLAKKARVASTVSSNRTCSDGRCRENKCGYGNPSTENRIFSKEPIYYGYG